MAVEKKKLLTFVTSWMDLESIMISEISRLVKAKYHMISPISEQYKLTKKKKNRNRGMGMWGRLAAVRG